MALWLYKTEPDCYSYANLEKDKATDWDGVTNALAQKHLRAAKRGDRILFYHTGDEKAIIGIMQVTGDPKPAPGDESGKQVVVPVKALKKLAKPVTLAEIKADKLFADWELVRISRLGVMPVSEERWKRIEEMAGE